MRTRRANRMRRGTADAHMDTMHVHSVVNIVKPVAVLTSLINSTAIKHYVLTHPSTHTHTHMHKLGILIMYLSKLTQISTWSAWSPRDPVSHLLLISQLKHTISTLKCVHTHVHTNKQVPQYWPSIKRTSSNKHPCTQSRPDLSGSLDVC